MTYFGASHNLVVSARLSRLACERLRAGCTLLLRVKR